MLNTNSESSDQPELDLASARQHMNELEQSVSDLTAEVARLRSIEALMQSVMDKIPGLIYAKDLQGHHFLINHAVELTTGLTRSELLGKTTHDIFPPDKAAMYDENDQNVIATGAAVVKEWEIMNSFHHRLEYYLSTSFPLFNADGEINATGGLIMNITARKQAELTLQDYQRQTKAMLDNAPAIIYIRSADGHYQLVNRQFAEQLQKSTGEIIGKTDYELFPEAVAHQYLKNHEHVLATNQVLETEWSNDDPDPLKRLTYTTTMFPLHDSNNTVYAVGGIAMDISARRQSEAAQQFSQEQEQIIRAQELVLAELATPLLKISNKALVMPLIGTIDSQRAQQVIVTLLEGVAQNQAQIAILDITGVSIVDTQVANGLIQAAQAVQLLGAQVIITGIRPEIAQTLVNLGVNLSTIMTLSSLHHGITYALRQE